MRVGPHHVGQRVVLRHALADGRATDVIGDLVAWDSPSGYARLVTRQGEVSVALADIILGKPVPPPPVRRLSVTELQDVMADGWQPLEREEYGGWRLRAAEGFTGRANSVLPLGNPPAPLVRAVDHVEQWYAARGLPARFAVPWPLGAGPGEPGDGQDPLDVELDARGYALDTPTLVMVRPLLGYPSRAALPSESRSAGPERPSRAAFEGYPNGEGLEVVVADEPDEGFLALYRYRGQDLPPVAARVMVSAPAQAFVTVRRPGAGPAARTIAVGRVASSRGWSGISAVEVAADHRRQGLGRVVMAALHDWAADRGDQATYLQVARSNVPGRALYDALGYTAHSGYHYRIRS
ncbi:MAG: GNAT family N-acetyltransferase [Actinomycetales bacterium]